jgi:hypothetical protein
MTRSVFGRVLAGIYFIIAIFITQDEIRHSAGVWISLRDYNLGFSGYAQLVAHVLVSTVLVYFIGAGIQWLVMAGFRAGGQAGS